MFVAPFPAAHSLPPVGQMLRLSSSGLSLHIPLVSFLISKASDKTIPASLITTSFLAVIPLDAVALTSTAPAAFAVSTPSAEISAADVLSPVPASATLYVTPASDTFSGITAAVNCIVLPTPSRTSPSDVRITDCGYTVSPVSATFTVCTLDTYFLPFITEYAVISAVPSDTAVTTPS